MEESYWFIRFSVFLTLDPNEEMSEIRGNAVFTLESKSFLPGSVISDLKDFYKKELAKNWREIKEIEIYIDSVLQIDQAGAADFSLIGMTTCFVRDRKIVSRHFAQKIKVVSMPTR